MKKAFSMILAIIFILAIASIGALSLSISSAGAKATTNIYLKEQAKLLADSATEYAVLKVQQNDFANNCIENIIVKYPNDGGTDGKTNVFRAELKLIYIGAESVLNQCDSKNKIVITNPTSDSGLDAVIISGKVTSHFDDQENISYSFNTTQIP